MAAAVARDGDRRAALAIFFLTLAVYAYFFNGASWNQNAHFDAIRSMVERRAINIDPYRTNTADLSYSRGHYYSNKPPGVPFLGALPYAILYGIERASGTDPAATLTMTLNLWLCTVAVCAISGALIPAALYLYARRRLGVTARTAAVAALLTAFGTYLFVYTTTLSAHVPSTAFLFLAFVQLNAFPDRRPWLAGVYGGVSVICNYLCLPALAIIILESITRRGGARRLVAVIAGGAPLALLLFVYQNAAFGSPFRTALERSSPAFSTPGAWLGSFVGPQLGALWGITFSPYRGLFFLCPILLAGIAGLASLWKRGMTRESIVIVSVLAFFIGANICFNYWDGGWAIGPRYIMPAVPFLAIAMVTALERHRLIWIAVGAVSVAVNLMVAAVDTQAPNFYRNPLLEYDASLFFTGATEMPDPRRRGGWMTVPLGHVAVNAHTPDEFLPSQKYGPDSRESEWASFNLGELVAPDSPLTVIPPLLAIAAGFAFLGASSRPSARGRPVDTPAR